MAGKNSNKASSSEIEMLRAENKKLKEEAASLEQNLQLYHNFFHYAPDGIFIANKDGKYVQVNPAASKVTGYSEKELLSMSILDLIPKENRESALNHFGKVAVDGCATGNLPFLKKDGSIGTWTVDAVKINDNCLMGFVKDITESKKVEARLHSEQIFIEMIIQNMPGLFYIFEGTSTTSMRRNSNWSKVTGYSDKELDTMSALDLVEDKELCTRKMHEMYELGASSMENPVVTKTGEVIPYYFEGIRLVINDKIYLVGMGIDISERKQAEEALMKEKNTSRQYLDIAEVMLIAININGHVTMVNKKACEILGYEEEEIININWFEKFIPKRFKEDVILVSQKIFTGQLAPIEYYENPVLTKSGEERLVAWHNSILKNDSGKVIGLLSSGEDITERKQAEDTLFFQSMLLDQIQDLVTATDLEGRITYVNESECKIFGKTYDELVGQNVSQYGEDSDRGATQKEIMTGTLSKGDWRGEVVNYTKDGEARVFDSRTKLIYNDRGEPIGMLGISTDITKRKMIEEALRDSEDKYRTLYNTMAQGVVYQNADGEIISANPAAERILGLSLDQMCGITSMDPRWKAIKEDGSDFPGEEHPIPVALKTGKEIIGIIQGVYHPVKEDYVWIRVSAVPLFRPGEKTPYQAYATFEDITERKQSEVRLFASEQKYRKLFNSMLDGFAVHEMIFDENRKPKDYRFLDINPAFEKLTGLKAKDIIGKTVLEVLPGIEPHWIEIYGNVVVTGESTRFENYSQDLDRFYEVTAYSNAEGQFTTVFVDVTERKKAEMRFESVASITSDLVYEWNVRTDELNWFGDMDAMLGYEKGEFPQNLQAYYDRVHPDDLTYLMESMDLHRTKPMHIIEQYRLQRKNGDWLYMTEYGKPILDKDGIPYMYIGGVKDITAQKKSEEIQHGLEQQLYQSQKLESIGRLAGGIAHDLNNMLTPIMGYSEMAMTYQVVPGDSLYEVFESILETAERAKKLVQQMLAFGRKQMLTIESVNVNNVINKFSKLINRTLREDIVIAQYLSPDLGNINADIAKIEQIILNLVVNAQSAMPDGGTLTIETKNVILDESYTEGHSEVEPGQYIVLVISDTGVGIEPDIISNIFEPFFTTKGVGEGSGLGLSTVYGLVKQHNGSVEVYSEVGNGTVFKVYFPRITEERIVGEISGSDLKKIQLGMGTILLAEDDVIVRKMLIKMLDSFGYTVFNSIDASDAIHIAKKQNIDLLLTDMIMPDMNGVQLYGEIKKIKPDIKVVFMSGYTDKTIDIVDISENGLAFIQKPINMQDLSDIVYQVMNDKYKV